MAEQNNYILALLLILAVGVLLITNPGATNPLKSQPVSITNWYDSYTAERKAAGIDDSFVAETALEDYSSPDLLPIIQEISSRSNTAEEAVQNALDYVYTRMTYQLNEPDDVCFYSTASQVLKRGTYNCDSGSRLVRTLLRGMGIAAVPVSGCLGISDSCRLTLAVQGIDVPQFKQLTDVDVKKGVVSRNGGLHAWDSVWLPGKGWKYIEPTAGRFANDLVCAKYLVEYIPQSVRDECTSSNPSFIATCKEY